MGRHPCTRPHCALPHAWREGARGQIAVCRLPMTPLSYALNCKSPRYLHTLRHGGELATLSPPAQATLRAVLNIPSRQTRTQDRREGSPGETDQRPILTLTRHHRCAGSPAAAARQSEWSPPVGCAADKKLRDFCQAVQMHERNEPSL